MCLRNYYQQNIAVKQPSRRNVYIQKVKSENNIKKDRFKTQIAMKNTMSHRSVTDAGKCKVCVRVVLCRSCTGQYIRQHIASSFTLQTLLPTSPAPQTLSLDLFTVFHWKSLLQFYLSYTPLFSLFHILFQEEATCLKLFACIFFHGCFYHADSLHFDSISFSIISESFSICKQFSFLRLSCFHFLEMSTIGHIALAFY